MERDIPRAAVLAAFALSVGLILVIVFALLRPFSNDPESAPAPVAPRPTASTPASTPNPSTPTHGPATTAGDGTSLVEQALNITATTRDFRPSPEQIADLASMLASYNATTTTRKQWERTQDHWNIYTPQDFPRSAVMNTAPSARQWPHAGSRVWTAGAAVPLTDSYGQGTLPVLSWSIMGFQSEFTRNGTPVDKFANEMFLTMQCAGDSIDLCRVLAYSTTTVLR